MPSEQAPTPSSESCTPFLGGAASSGCGPGRREGRGLGSQAILLSSGGRAKEVRRRFETYTTENCLFGSSISGVNDGRKMFHFCPFPKQVLRVCAATCGAATASDRMGERRPEAPISCGNCNKLSCFVLFFCLIVFCSSFSLLKDKGVCDMHRTAED